MGDVDGGSDDRGLGVEETIVDGVVMLHVRGELDVATSWQLRTRLLAALGERDYSTVAIDMAGITFMDSSGLGLLLGLGEELRRRDVTLEVRAPSPSVRRVLALAGLEDRAFVVEDTALRETKPT
jgi:anti-anti-sigma factor